MKLIELILSSPELAAAQCPVLSADVDQPADPVVPSAGAGHERKAEGLHRGVQGAQGVGG